MRGRLEDEELWISVHVACELFAGAELAKHRAEERQRVSNFCDAVQIAYPGERFAQTYGRLQAALQRSGHTIGAMDLLIATAAVVDGAPLVTRNASDFSRVPGLALIGY
jgi:predicted nucleic acid-binding protein